jgi:aspartyl-tRNA(Asn)/glutamyl-tRNA(Gln) amidotransferase subunit A
LALKVSEAVANIRRGAISCEELMRHCLERIASLNPTVNAFSSVFEETAIIAARNCDSDAHEGKWRGPLHGIPVGVKDLFLTKGLITARGSRAFANHVPTENSPVIDRILQAGGIIIGKTTTTELGWSGSSVSEFYGCTRNPWNLELTSGGSSSGSAAALAAGMVPVTLGSDGGGSLRIPASFCGVFAMKGSLGRVPAYPWSATEMLSHAGPMTRTVKDSQIMFDILKGPDWRDHLSLPDEGLKYQDVSANLKSLRIVFAPSLFGYKMNAGIAATIANAVEEICKNLDVTIDKVEPGWGDPIEIFETLWVAGRGVAYGGQIEDHSEFGSGFRNLIEHSKKYGLADYLHAMKCRAQFSQSVHAFFDDVDILLMPTVPEEAFDASLEGPAGMTGKSAALPWTAWTPFTYPFNLSGNPAASMPCGFTPEGMPVGLQVIGRRFEDSTVLAFCRELEKAFSWTDSTPPIAMENEFKNLVPKENHIPMEESQ